MARRASIVFTLRKVVEERGWKGAFLGVAPRVAWISVGGAVFFGSYEAAKELFQTSWT